MKIKIINCITIEYRLSRTTPDQNRDNFKMILMIDSINIHPNNKNSTFAPQNLRLICKFIYLSINKIKDILPI